MTEQELEYRGIRTVIGDETNGARPWTIHPQGAPPVGGISRATEAGRGSFKEAVFAARRAIDMWLESGRHA